jgi:hypothetical protein
LIKLKVLIGPGIMGAGKNGGRKANGVFKIQPHYRTFIGLETWTVYLGPMLTQRTPQ